LLDLVMACSAWLLLLLVSGVLLTVVTCAAAAAATLAILVRRLRMPTRLILLASGLQFRAPVRRVTIPWSDLVAVLRGGGGRNLYYVWKAMDRKITTPTGFTNEAALFTEVSRRATNLRTVP
jgi:hypothetical protein